METNIFNINPLPSLTWNWLGLNDTQLNLPKTVLPCEIMQEDGNSVKKEFFTQKKADDRETKQFNNILTGTGKNADKLFEQNEIPIYQFMTNEGENSGTVRLHISENNEKEDACSVGKINILAEKNSKITVVMDYTKVQEKSSVLALRTRLKAGNNAKIRLIQIQFMDKFSTLVNDVGGVCDENGSIEILQLFLGKGDVYSGSRVDLIGNKSSFNAETGYLGQGTQKIDLNMVANHIGKNTQSFIRADGTLKNNANKVFRGTIDFKTGASGSEGEETENVLLLGDNVINKTIPLILCAEEDVKGSHGATIGELDEDMLFYFASRGIGADKAEEIVTRGKLLRLCNKIQDEETESYVRSRIEEVMEND